jgi:hypothetical protein
MNGKPTELNANDLSPELVVQRHCECVPRGVSWSPDGSTLALVEQSNSLRFIQISELNKSSQTDLLLSRASLGEAPLDWTWWPSSPESQPNSLALAIACKSHPPRLIDASVGTVRASYNARTDAESLCPAHSLSITHDGSALVAGSDAKLSVYPPFEPAARCESLALSARERFSSRCKRKSGQYGLVSAVETVPATSSWNSPLIAAAGTFESDLVGVYDLRCGSSPGGANTGCIALGSYHEGGITSLRWSPCGLFLFSGARKDYRVVCSDVRMPGEASLELPRDTLSTNQRIFFDVDCSSVRHIITGTTRGRADVVDIQRHERTGWISVDTNGATVSSASVQPNGGSLVATTSGEASFAHKHGNQLAAREGRGDDDNDGNSSSEDSSGSERMNTTERALKVWRVNRRPLQQDPCGHGPMEIETERVDDESAE